MYVTRVWIGLAAFSMALAGCCDGSIEGNYPGDVTPLAGSHSTMAESTSDVVGPAEALDQARISAGLSVRPVKTGI